MEASCIPPKKRRAKGIGFRLVRTIGEFNPNIVGLAFEATAVMTVSSVARAAAERQ